MVIAHGKCKDVGLIAAQTLLHAPQREDVAGKNVPLAVKRPARINGLSQWTSVVHFPRAAIGATEDLRGCAFVAVFNHTVRIALGYQEFLAVQAVAKGLPFCEGQGRCRGKVAVAVAAVW